SSRGQAYASEQGLKPPRPSERVKSWTDFHPDLDAASRLGNTRSRCGDIDLLSLRFDAFEFSKFIKFVIVRAVELVDVVIGKSPAAGSGRPWFRQNLRIVDGDLNDEVVHGRTRVALDHMQLIAVEPSVRHDERS